MIRRQFLAALACVPGVGVLLREKTSARGRRLTFVAQNGESHTIHAPPGKYIIHVDHATGSYYDESKYQYYDFEKCRWVDAEVDL